MAESTQAADNGLAAIIAAAVAQALEPVKNQLAEVNKLRTDLDSFKCQWKTASASHEEDAIAALTHQAALIAEQEKLAAQQAEADKARGRHSKPY